jgi:sulfonate transport system ATP-binding protein
MLQISGVSKRFDTRAALAPFDLDVLRGEILAIVGTSGCGKSTLLRIIGGLERPSAGSVHVDGAAVEGPRPDLAFVFQEPRLMPWLTVRENVEFGLRGRPKAERRALAREALERVRLASFADALPRQLSGGMAQRVALARALVTRPAVLLLDEPFSAVDAVTRQALQDHLLELWREDRPTMLFVTHDIEEALVIADRVLVLAGQPGVAQAEIRLDLPRPRRRTDPRIVAWRERLFDNLSGAAPAREAA